MRLSRLLHLKSFTWFETNRVAESPEASHATDRRGLSRYKLAPLSFRLALMMIPLLALSLALVTVVSAQTPVGPTDPPASDCTSGKAVPDPDDHSGMVADCVALMASGDTLQGTSTLDWSYDRYILTGIVRPELRHWSELRYLYLNNNELGGLINASLGNLTKLSHLSLQHNQLTGMIPVTILDMDNLERLQLSGNQLTGGVPAGLLSLKVNDLSSLGLPTCTTEQLCANDANHITVPGHAEKPGPAWSAIAPLSWTPGIPFWARRTWTGSTDFPSTIEKAQKYARGQPGWCGWTCMTRA